MRFTRSHGDGLAQFLPSLEGKTFAGVAVLFIVALMVGPTQAQELRVLKKGLGEGTVTSTPPGIICPGDCDETFASGTPVNLTAIASQGSAFAGWELAGTGTAASRDVVMSGNRLVRAVFEQTLQQTFADGDVNTATNIITLPAHGFIADKEVQLVTTGTLPAGLALGTSYFVQPVDADSFELSLTAGGTAVNITAATGGGAHTVLPDPVFRRQIFADSAVATGTDTINLPAHGFAADERIRLLTIGTLPAGLNLATTYFIRPTDANNFRLALAPGGTAVDITAATGGGTHTVLPEPISPIRDFLQKTFTDGNVNTTTDAINITRHGFIEGQKVVLETTGTLPTGLLPAATYFVLRLSENSIGLSTAPGRAAINITAATGGGTHTVFPEGATPEAIQAFLDGNPGVNTSARFIKALGSEYKQNWLLMTRSESLQTGTAESPRILLPSQNAEFVYTVGMITHGSYPASHPNAIEYMQWDPGDKNFRFHEIVLAPIPAMGGGLFPARTRGVSIDDSKCSKCHSTRNVLNRSPYGGTTGFPIGLLKAKNKPNWDTYDSWGGLLPFNRDRIYQGSVEAASFRRLFNLWTWRENDPIRTVIEQLDLQPPGVPTVDEITRTVGGINDGHINFAFDLAVDRPVLVEPLAPSSVATESSYEFNKRAGTGTATPIARDTTYVTMRHTSDISSTGPNIEGRGINFFDHLGGFDGDLNPQRIADELIDHRFATGSIPIDVRPIALAITKLTRPLRVNTSVSPPTIESASGLPTLTVSFAFFDGRHGLNLGQIIDDTRERAFSMPRRKADLQKLNLDRTGDIYLESTPTPGDNLNGLIQEDGARTSGIPMVPGFPELPGTDTSLRRIRQEVFRRPIDLGVPDRSNIMGPTVSGTYQGIYVDREDEIPNIEMMALYRYFLEPLGVSVDKWSMGVRGRSRTYTFADVFGFYTRPFEAILTESLQTDPIINPGTGMPFDPTDDADLIRAVNFTLASATPATVTAIPTFTDIQRIFNKSCIECHGGLDYPPYSNSGSLYIDFSEDENPTVTVPPIDSRLARSYDRASSLTPTTNPADSRIYQLITRTSEDCTNPLGGTHLMPCGGPALSQVDIQTIRRWIEASSPPAFTHGDPHIRTVQGINYDFQAAGEFVLLRGTGVEIQARHTAVQTNRPLGPNGYTGLTSCVSINTAIAVRVAGQRITYQPDLNGEPNPDGLQLRIDGDPVVMSSDGIPLAQGARIIQTPAQGGIQIEGPGGLVIVITPGFWNHYQVWYLNLDIRHARATQGLMGVIQPGNWLPALPDGTLLGPKPRDISQRYQDLYDRFGSAWRVTDDTSLFDYAPGTSTATFSMEGWPGSETPNSCEIPDPPLGTPTNEPQEPLALEVAQQLCGDIVDKDRQANCIQDVMITGETGFAATYLLADQIAQNAAPDKPVLTTPDEGKINVASSETFHWNPSIDADGDPVTYRLFVWPIDEFPEFSQAEIITPDSVSGGFSFPLLILLLGCLLWAILFWLGLRRKPAWLAIAAMLILVCVYFAYYYDKGGPGSPGATMAKSVRNLESGKSYYWKVLAEDGKGGTVQSAIRRFDVE